MAQQIAVGNEILEFPDSMSDAEISNILKTKYKPIEAPSGFAKGLKDLVSGGGQAVARGLETAAEYVGYQPAIDFLSKERQKYEDIIKKEETQYQAQRKAAGETGVDWGRIGGNIANPLNYIGMGAGNIARGLGITTRAAPGSSAIVGAIGRGTEALGAVPEAGAILSTVGRGIEALPSALTGNTAKLFGAGAVQGAAAPIYNTDEYGGQLVQNVGEGILTAGLFGVGAKALKGGYNAVSDLIAPMTESGRQRLAQQFVQSTVPTEAIPQVQAAIRNPNIYVEGSTPTVGEAVAHIPEAANLASLQAKMMNAPEVAPIFAARDIANEAARANAVAKLGGEFVSDAQKARTALTTPMKEAALSAAKPIQADSLASALETVANSKTYKGTGIAEDSLKYFANAFKNAADENGLVTPQAMYNIRKRVGQSIQGISNQSGISSLDASAIEAGTAVKKIIDNAIESTGGKGWKNYLTAFEQESTKIDRMKVGEYLQSTLGGKFNAENAGAFANAMLKAPETLKASTGVARYKELSDLLSKGDVKLLQGVNDDILREQTFKTLASKSTQGTKFADGETIPHFLNRTATITNYALKKFNSDADRKINQYLAGLDNEKWAALFDAVPPNKAEAWVKAVFPRLTPEVRSNALRSIGLVGSEALRRETAMPGEQLQMQQTPQETQPQSKAAIQNLLVSTIQQKQVPPELARVIPAVVQTESSWNPNAANKNSSAKGLFQMTNAARADVGIPRNATIQQDIEGGIDYLLKMYRKYGDVAKAIQAYNQGHYNPKSKEGKQYVATVYRNM